MLKPEGIIPAMVTPMNSDQELDEEGLRQSARRLIAAGVHGLFCLGTNGEFFSLRYEEKLRVARIVVEEAKGRVPVYAGAGCISTEETVRLARDMEDAGVDALSVITPYFLTYTQDELLRHYMTLADSTRLPIVLYNIPARTGNALQPETVERLSRVEGIVGIKDSSGSFDNMLRYLESASGDFSVLAGTDSLILSVLMSGGSGAIAATANLFPELLVSIYELWKQGRLEEAEHKQRQLRAIRAAFQWGTLPSVLKEAMNLCGLPAGPCRMPVGPLPEARRQELRRLMDRYREQGLLGQQQPASLQAEQA